MAAENVEHMSNITITLLIENENDNIPTFDSTSYKANLSENAQKGEFIILTKVEHYLSLLFIRCYLQM